jgi:hypothetical protein
MSEHEQKDKKKSRDIFGVIGDATYDAHEKYRGFWYDMWSSKYGLAGVIIAVIFSFGPDILTDGLGAVIILGIVLLYVLLRHYVHEIENDEESVLYKVMKFIHSTIIFVVVCALLYFFVVVLLYMFKDAGVIK